MKKFYSILEFWKIIPRRFYENRPYDRRIGL